MKNNKILWGLAVSSLLYAQNVEDLMGGFDDTPITIEKSDTLVKDTVSVEVEDNTTVEEATSTIKEFSGKLTQQIAYSYLGDSPHHQWTSFKSSLFLDFEHKFKNDLRIKLNAKAYYDAIYDLKDEVYSQDELAQLRSEVELFDAYIEGSITDTLDFKLGRQVVVWGRSDTIRITDVLNPLDNRRPGMVDIEDLRLPIAMLKLDYFVGEWRITPMVILEQRFSKNPPYQSAFNKAPHQEPKDEEITQESYALSIGAEFSGWDISFYASRLYHDQGYIDMILPTVMKHTKIDMYGTAFNILRGSWLFKTELAYFNHLKFTSIQDKTFSRTDGLIGLEYKGIADTMISYDISLRHLHDYDTQLSIGNNPLEQDSYQHAFRVSSDFMNASLSANYLISLYGKALDQGGFQRLWMKYELAEGIHTTVGLVDYIGGSKRFDAVADNDMIFGEISYSF